MNLPDNVHVDVADGLVVLQVRAEVVLVTAREARLIAEELQRNANVIDPKVRPKQTEPGAP